ncbi:MAG: GPO family capsid scaffolding protein [Pseudomonadota bacterium]
MAKSKFFRVAVEGATVDGRTIDRKWLEEMAATYDRNTYAARVNLEHIRGITAEPPFQSLGDVLSLKTEEVDLTVGGKTERRLALFAEINALDPLLQMNRKRQKLYTSIEINPSFSSSGKAYLMGLAVTDSPASLGTEMLEFAAKATVNPFAARKQQPGNFFSAAEEAQIELIDDAPNADPTGVFAAIKGMFERFTPAAPPQQQLQTPPSNPADPQQPAPSDFAAIGMGLGAIAAGMEKMAASNTASFSALGERLTAVEQLTANTPQHGQQTRPPATGMPQNFVATDC